MSGTDQSKAPGWSPDGPVSILVEPQMGENIGAAARAMWNFGLRGLRVVNPRDGWPNPAAVAMASGAGGGHRLGQLLAGLHLRQLCAADLHQQPHDNPAASSRPSITFMFCIAWPAAPLPRLSMAAVSTTCPPTCSPAAATARSQ